MNSKELRVAGDRRETPWPEQKTTESRLYPQCKVASDGLAGMVKDGECALGMSHDTRESRQMAVKWADFSCCSLSAPIALEKMQMQGKPKGGGRVRPHRFHPCWALMTWFALNAFIMLPFVFTLLLMYKCVSVSICVYACACGCLQRPKSGTGSSGAGVKGIGEPSNMVARNLLQVLGKSSEHS